SISSVNYIIEEIEKTDVVFNNTGQKEIITGELYGLRAALHFDLLRLFHPSYKVNPDYRGIPYMKNFGTTVSNPLTTSDVLENIITDLEYAAKQLENYDPVITGQSTYTANAGQIDSRLRTFQMNYYAVRAVQARVYLYKEEYKKAYDYAVEVFEQENLSSTAQIYYFFNPGDFADDYSFSREHIFGISSLNTGLTTISEELFEQREIRVASKFLDVYPVAADTRYRTWFEMQADNTFIMSRKYSRLSMLNDYVKTLHYNASLPVRIPFIKLGKVCLIAAEALNQLDELGDAAQFVMKMQLSKGLSIVEELENNGQLNKETLAEEIRHEYYREFWGEGQLFYFFKRMNDASIMAYDGTLIQMNDSKYTLPIPAKGISVNN
ncbi:MAG: RagB/SusD family nutrient uptake outer membrane protein, partial [Odoribacter sp.]|nr:RagB/SusD family nutrient uptake outer membrane protein [Odoribacter sp.]